MAYRVGLKVIGPVTNQHLGQFNLLISVNCDLQRFFAILFGKNSEFGLRRAFAIFGVSKCATDEAESAMVRLAAVFVSA